MSQRAVLIAAVLGIAGSGAMLHKVSAKPKLLDAASKDVFDACVQVTAQGISRLLGGTARWCRVTVGSAR
jgi:hypothetical protein